MSKALRSTSPTTDGAGPVKSSRAEPASKSYVPPPLNPDLPRSLSSVPLVQDWIDENNRQVKPKKRLRAAEFLNDALVRLGDLAIAGGPADEDHVFTVFHEFIQAQHAVPRSTTLARLFFQWHKAHRNDLCDRLMVSVLDAKQQVPPAAFTASIDERVVTVALRALAEVDGMSLSRLQTVLDLVAPDRRKRRLFFPMLQYAESTGDAALAEQMLELSAANGVELWDADFHCLLTCVAKTVAAASNPHIGPPVTQQGSPNAFRLMDKIMMRMELEHPVVGRRNAELIESLLGGAKATISESGVCSRCHSTLRSFELNEEDRQTLLDGIVNGLVRPRVQGVSHYEPEKTVSQSEADTRWATFEAFTKRVASLPYDTLIDGANVGYYGLNSWYHEAKTAQLRADGVAVPAGKHYTVPFPVDVPPKFELIDNMKCIIEARGHKPLIVLHARHVQGSVTNENKRLLSKWQEKGTVIASPAFLNDDYCWLYAAVARPHTYVVSNDQMRDHHFLALKPSCFIRWRQRHRLTYRVLFHRATKTTTLSVNALRAYSVWVQRAVSQPPVSHWHIPFLSNIDVLEQATNKVESGAADVELSKDGDDECSSWVCTWRGESRDGRSA